MHNVHQRLPKQKSVGRNRDLIVTSQFDGLVFLCGEDAEIVTHFTRELSELHRLWLEQNFSTFHARQCKQRLDQVIEPLSFFQHAPDGLAQGRWIVCLSQGNFTDGAQSGERCAKFVRSIGRKSFQFSERVLQPLQCLVEHRSKLAELIVRIRIGQPFGQRLRSDLFRLIGHRSDGRERTSCNKIAAERRQ